MRYLVNSGEMRRYDANTIEKIGIPGMVLMERAALEAVRFLREKFSGDLGKVLVMAGSGNNGADGLAAARMLADGGFAVDVWFVGDEAKASKQWTQQRQILENYNVSISDTLTDGEYTILVDALFGVGLSREVSGIYADAVRTFNQRKGYKLALDVPSGVDSDTGKILGCAVKADATVTFGFCKRGLVMYPGCLWAGEIFVADIGITQRSFMGQEPEMFCYDSVSEEMPRRDPAGNKGTFGKVLLVAGNQKMAGAAVLCAKAAYRTGAGMVKVISAQENRAILQTAVPEALFGAYGELDEAMEWADVIAVGPGIGVDETAGACLEKVIRKSLKPLLIDADGLNLLAKEQELQEVLSGQDRALVLTPHVGELSRLTNVSIGQLKERLWEHGAALAAKLHAVVVAKDARTFVCAKERPICVNILGNSGIATAGSGDVLTGITAAVMAQLWKQDAAGDAQGGTAMQTAFRAACQGVVLHAAAGDEAALQKGEYGCIAGDIVEAVAEVLRKGQIK